MTLSRPLRKRLEWKRCREQVLGPCADEVDQCCAIVPCKLCLFLEEYGSDDLFVTAEFDGEFYLGTIDGLSFVGFWERRGGICYFVVEIDDVEVFAGEVCEGYDALTCRDPGGEVVLGDGRTLRWETVEPLQLPHDATNPYCKEPFCGTCTCLPSVICITVQHGSCISRSQLDIGSTEDCPDLEWDIEIECGDISETGVATLFRDPYGDDCVLSLDAFGQLVEHRFTSCDDFEKTFSFSVNYDETLTVTLSFVDCGCGDPKCVGDGCCPDSQIDSTELQKLGQDTAGALGCPDAATEAGPVNEQETLALGDNSLLEELMPGTNFCSVWQNLSVEHEVPWGLLGGLSFDVVIGCTAADGAVAFIRYSIPPDGIEADVWIQTTAGVECPDCSSEGPHQVTMWYDIYATCATCNNAEYEYEPVEGCVPSGTVYSVRKTFVGASVCEDVL